MRFVTWLLSTAAGITVAAWLFDGIAFRGATEGMAEVQDKWFPLLVVTLILGVVSALVKPVVSFFSIPLIILTVGLFLLVINALMLMLTDWITDQLDIGFRVDGFWTALFGALVITIVSWGVDTVLRGDD